MRLCQLDEAEARRIADATRRWRRTACEFLGSRKARSIRGGPARRPRGLPLRFLGLVGLSDPVRPTARPAIDECHAAGIRVVMISGDYPVTAKSIAHQVGLDAQAEVLTGAELAAMDDAELRRRIPSVNVFARILPEQKVRIVEALKATGEIVAMTGDGVNDAPALKAAHIGIAMGGRGTDVAREAAELVLLDDDFASLELAVRTGRRIYDNLQKALAYILAVHLPILGLTLVPIVAGWPLVLMPIHIAFLHLVIDPACSVVFEAEPEEADVMRRPPRPTTERLFGRRLIGISLSLGPSVTAILLGHVRRRALWRTRRPRVPHHHLHDPGPRQSGAHLHEPILESARRAGRRPEFGALVGHRGNARLPSGGALRPDRCASSSGST